MTRARNLSGLSTVTGQPTTTTPVNLGPLGVGTFARIYGTWEHDQINAVSVAATNLQVSGITTGLNVSGIITAQNGLNVTGNIVNGLNVSAGIATFAGAIDANGNVDFAGNLTVAGTATYEDLTDIDSIGVGTFRKGIIVAGVSTFQNNLVIPTWLVHAGDTDTKFGFEGPDTFTVETGGSERLRVDSNGRVLVGTTTEGEASADNLTVASPAGNAGITIRSATTSTGNVYFSDGTSGGAEYDGYIQYKHDDNYLRFATAQTERIRIDSSGRVLIGHNASRASAGGEPILQVQKNSSELATFIRTSNDGGGGYIALAKSRSSAGAVCQAGDNIGVLGWYPHDGTDLNHSAAEIRAYVDTGIGSNDTPGYLTFYTNGGTTTSTERLRIRSDGTVDIGGGSHSRNLTVHSATNSVILIEGNSDATSNLMFGDQDDEDVGLIQYNHASNYLAVTVNAAERVRIENGGNVDFFGGITVTGITTLSGKVGLDTTGALNLPRGTTSERPTDASTTTPYIRWNTTNSALEFYNGSSWVEIISDYFPQGSLVAG